MSSASPAHGETVSPSVCGKVVAVCFAAFRVVFCFVVVVVAAKLIGLVLAGAVLSAFAVTVFAVTVFSGTA